MTPTRHGVPLAELLGLITEAVEVQLAIARCAVRLVEPTADPLPATRGWIACACGETAGSNAGRRDTRCWAEPIEAIGGESLGSLACHGLRDVEPHPADVEVMQEAARLAGIAIERKRTENELQIAASVHQAIGEGIETAKQCERLKAAGCDYGQGFLPIRQADAGRRAGRGAGGITEARAHRR